MNHLNRKNIVITSGGTREYIDDVRVITNISTGALGAHIALEFYNRGYNVHYIHSKGAVIPTVVNYQDCPELHTYQYVTTNDLERTMKAVITSFNADAVIHSAAVSDFTFDRSEKIKLSSSDKEAFIEFMKRTIKPTNKIIGMVKSWQPSTILVGFKFTVGKTREEREQIVQKLMEDNKCEIVVSNDKKEMEYRRDHIAKIYDNKKGILFSGKQRIAKGLFAFVEKLI